MAVTSSIANLNTADFLVSTQGKRSLKEQFEALPGEIAPTVGIIGYGESVKVGSDWKYEWMLDEEMPVKVTTTSALVTADTTLTMSTTDINRVQVGQVIVIKYGNEETVRVTANTGSAVTMTRAFAGTTATTHSNGATGYLLPPHFRDNATFQESPKQLGEFTFNYPASFLYELTESDMRTAQSNYLTQGQDELAFHKARLMRRAVKELNNALWFSKKADPGASPYIGAFDGIRTLVTTNATTVTGLLTPTHLEDTLDLIYAKDPSMNHDIFGNRKSKRIFDALMRQFFNREAEPTHVAGIDLTVDHYHSNLGTFRFIVEPNLPDGELYILKKGDMKIHPLDVGGLGTGWVEFDREAAHTNSRERQTAIALMATFCLYNQKRHGKITGFTSMVASYAGAV